MVAQTVQPSAKYRQTGRVRSVREWPLSEQPREKLRHFGPARLSNAELLSIVLRDGQRRGGRGGPGHQAAGGARRAAGSGDGRRDRAGR